MTRKHCERLQNKLENLISELIMEFEEVTEQKVKGIKLQHYRRIKPPGRQKLAVDIILETPKSFAIVYN